VEVQQLYRAMDFLLDAKADIEKEVFRSVSHLFNLEVDLVFVDTTSTYFEIEEPDEDSVNEETGEAIPGLRKRSRHSKDKRPDLPQAVIGFAVTRDGIPVKSWVWPGNTVDVSVVDEIKRDLNDWQLSRMVLVMDTGFNSEANRRTLQGAGSHFIIGEKMRQTNKQAMEALKRAGRYQAITPTIKAKEVIVNEGSVAAERFIIVVNEKEAQRDAAKRNDIVSETERRITELGDLAGEEHTKRVCELIADKTFGRYVREQKNGQLKLDKGKIASEAKLDGKYLIRTSDPHLSVEDVVLGYKQLFEIERVNRDLKHTIDVRPVYHRREDRIKAHVLLCWLALLLIRVAENESQESWHCLKKIFRSLQAADHATPQGTITQTNKLTAEQKRVLDAINVKPPKRFLHMPTQKTARKA